MRIYIDPKKPHEIAVSQTLVDYRDCYFTISSLVSRTNEKL